MEEERKPSILLGNGFNLALKEVCEISALKFGYKDILAAVINKIKSEKKYMDLVSYLEQSTLDDQERISDIELLLWILKYSKECIKYCKPIYCEPITGFIERLEEHRQILKQKVIEIMTDPTFHPSHSSIFNNGNLAAIEKCGNNLQKFKRIFTTNYDLILYWLLNNQKLLEKRKPNGANIISGVFKDGFTQKRAFMPKDDNEHIIDNFFGCSSTNNYGNLLFLHGALHLLQKDNDTFKVVANGSYMPLQELRNDLLDKYKAFENLIVFDATSNEKVSHIYTNSYLRKAYDKLARLDDELIIFGCSIFKENQPELGNDAHLWQRIINSSVKDIYISSSESPEKFEEQAAVLINALKPYKYIRATPNLHLFPHREVNIWLSANFYQAVIEESSIGFPIE